MQTPAIIRNGWWVALIGVAVSLAIIIAALSSTRTSRPQGADTGEFDLESAKVPRQLIVRAMDRDGLRALTDPSTLEPADIAHKNEEERGKLLVGSDRVIGVEINGEARAYPLRLMRWHEVVNDRVGDQAIAVTYSPLCDSAAVYSRRIDGNVADIGLSGLLFQSNPLLYDRRLGPATSPLWVQLTGNVVAGASPDSASGLLPLPASLVTWAEWLSLHPGTTILAPEEDLKKLYKRDPYHSYFGSDVLRFPVDPIPTTHELRLKDRVVVITVNGEDSVYGLPQLAAAIGKKRGVIEISVADLPIRLSFDAEIGTASAEVPSDPSRLQGVRLAFWFAWYALEGTIPANIQPAVTERQQSKTRD